MRATMSIIGLYNYDQNLFDDLSLPDGVDDELIINNILMECAELETVYTDPEFMKFAIKYWSAKELPVWDRIYRAELAEYNPIENYDRNEEITENRAGHSAAENKSNRTTGRTAHDQTILEQETGGTHEEHNSNTEHSDTTNVIAGFNTDPMRSKDASVVNVVGNTGNSSSDTGSTTSSGNTNSVENQNEQAATESQLNNTESMQHINHTHGNIGVTTSQQMLESELEIAPKLNVVNYIVTSFKQRFCLLVY